MNIRETIKRHPVATYFILAFGIAWGGILFVVGPGGIPGSGAQLGRLLPLVFLAMIAGPSVASIVLTGLVDGKEGYRALLSRLGRWRVSIR